MRVLPIALAVAILLPCASARASPISVVVTSSSGGFAADATTQGVLAFDLGTLTMPGGSSGSLLIAGLDEGADYTLKFMLEGAVAFDSLRAEIFDPIDDDDGWDVAGQPSMLPAGYSTSNDLDGFSFAQGSGVLRNAVFPGGSASVFADEVTHSGDVLLFSGLAGAFNPQFSFGLRDFVGDRGFVLNLTASDAVDAAATPEPASLLLMGTGLAGLAAARRRRKRQLEQLEA